MSNGQPVDVYHAPQTVEPEESLEPSLTIGGSPPSDAGGLPPIEELPVSIGGFDLKRIIIIVLAVLVLGGIGWYIIRFLKGGSVDKAVTLTYWGLWEPEEVMKTVIEDYQREHPNVTISYSMQSPTQYRERLQAAIGRGEGPDIFRFHNTWLPMLRGSIVAIPKEVISTREFQDAFYPVAQKDLLVNNKFYGVPLEIDGLVLLYNKKLLESENLPVPVTWSEFENAALALTVKDMAGTITQAGAALGTAENIEHFSDILGLIFLQNATDFNILTSDKADQALTYYSLFAQKPNNIWDSEQDNSIVAFSQGKVAFIFAPSWQIHTIKSKNPSLDFGVASVPQIEGATPVSWATYWVEGVSVKSTQAGAAFEFLKYLSSNSVLTKLFTESTKVRSLFGEPYSRVDLNEAMRGNKFLQPLADQAPQMRSWYLSSRTFDNGINDKIINYFKDAVNSMLAGSSARGALGTVDSGVASVLKEYGVK